MNAIVGFIGGLRPQELIIILLIVLVLFGARKLPEIGKGLGKGIREFRDATKGLSDDVEEGMRGDEEARASKPADPPKSE